MATPYANHHHPARKLCGIRHLTTCLTLINLKLDRNGVFNPSEAAKLSMLDHHLVVFD